MPLLNNEAERGWGDLVRDVHGLFKRRKEEETLKSPVVPRIEEKRDVKRRRNVLLEILVASIITAIGLSIGYWIFNFIVRFL